MTVIIEPDGTISVPLTLAESGVLCYRLMLSFLEYGGIDKVARELPWLVQLYEKLAEANDKLIGKAGNR